MNDARKLHVKLLTRAKRLNAVLNKAIRLGDPKRIAHFQQLVLPFYGIPHGDWYVSQTGKHKEKS